MFDLSCWGDRFSGNAPLKTRQIKQRLDQSSLVGILNATPDSFSDGGLFNDLDKAVAHGSTMVRIGTAIFGARENKI